MKHGAYISPQHWSQAHQDGLDFWDPKLMKTMDSIPARPEQFHKVNPRALHLFRDFPLSDQHSDMWKDPRATGVRHALDWADKLRRWYKSGALTIPREQIIVMGINEPEVWRNDRPRDIGGTSNPLVLAELRRKQGFEALQALSNSQGGDANPAPTAGVQVAVEYNYWFLETLTNEGLRGTALNMAVGWPTNYGVKDAPPDWVPFEPVHQAMVRGNHPLVLHEYSDKEGFQKHWGWWCGRYTQCPWQDIWIIIGEMGIEQGISDLSQFGKGWAAFYSQNPKIYVDQLNWYAEQIGKDPRVHSFAIYMLDYADNYWHTMDITPIVTARMFGKNTEFDNGKAPVTVPQPPTNPNPTTPPADFPVGFDHYKTTFIKEGAEHQVPWQLLAAVAKRESNYNPKANGAAGEKGMMQFMPSTWADEAPKVGFSKNHVEAYDPHKSIKVAANFLAWMKRYLLDSKPEATDWKWALVAYNWGIGNANRTKSWTEIPGSVNDYVTYVINEYERLLGPAQPDPVPTPGKKLKGLILPLKNPGKPTQHFVGNYDWYKANSVVGHNGTDWGVPVGTPLYSVADGVVEWVDTDVDDKGAIKGWGNYIRIWHPDYGFHSFLAHMREQSKLKKGDVIKQGDVVGYTGNTGWSTGPHLHYSVRLAKPDSQYLGTTANTKGYVDPLLFHDWVNAWLVPSSGSSSDTSKLEAALKVIADLKATIKQISDIASKAGS